MRKVSIALAGLGAFIVVASLLLRFYAYDQLAVAPADQDSTTTLVGPNATVFSVAEGEEVTTDLTTSVRTIGDIEAAEEAGGDTVVWVSTSSTQDSAGDIRSRSVDRVAFDRVSGEAVNCCGEYYETVENEPEPIEHQGLLVKFPFDTQKQTYEFWDSTLREALPIEYQDTEEVAGVETYRFQQVIEPTVYATIDAPASFVDAEEDADDAGNVEVERTYANTRTLWVEPNTGVIIDREEQQKSTLRYEGEDRVTTTEVTTGFDEATIEDNADTYGPKGSQLALIHGPLTIITTILGLLMIAAAAGLMLVARREE